MASSETTQPGKTSLIAAIGERIGPGVRGVLPFWVFGGAVIAFVWAIGTFLHIRFGFLTRDPTAVMWAPLYAGMMSVIGGLCWAAAAGICLFSAWLLRGSKVAVSAAFFLCTGAFLLWLMGDDVFQFHEDLFPKHLHIKELYVEAAYPVLALLWVGVFWRVILKTNWLILGTAFFFLAISEYMDAILHTDTNINVLIEDGAKLMGIVTWLAYVVNTGSHAVADLVRSRSAG